MQVNENRTSARNSTKCCKEQIATMKFSKISRLVVLQPYQSLRFRCLPVRPDRVAHSEKVRDELMRGNAGKITFDFSKTNPMITGGWDVGNNSLILASNFSLELHSSSWQMQLMQSPVQYSMRKSNGHRTGVMQYFEMAKPLKVYFNGW